MAAPNLKNPTTIVGITSSVGIGTTVITGILTNNSGSNKVYKINSIIAANVSFTNASNFSVSILRNNNDRYLARNIQIPVGSTQIISTKENYFYLEENVGIKAQSTVANGIDLTISYEEIV